MPIFRERIHTSVTVKINQIAESARDDIDDSPELFLSQLLELIRLQGSGPSEAARAIRKKIKYGEEREQLRALQILELLISNAGPKIAPVIARDDKLLDVLKGIVNGHGRTGDGGPYPKRVQNQTRGMALEWKNELSDLEAYRYLADLWKSMPKAKKSHSRTPSQNVFESELDDDAGVSSPRAPPARPRTSKPASERSFSPAPARSKKSKKDKRRKRRAKYADSEYEIPQINYTVEAPKIRALIADTHTNSTSLTNVLMQLAPGQLPTDDARCTELFQKCKSNRRKVLRYLQYVGAGGSDKPEQIQALDEEFLGALITANEQLVGVFTKYDFHCGYTVENPAPNYDDDEDSDESYYSDETSDDDLDESVDRLQELSVGSSSEPSEPSKPSAPRAAKAPPPRPPKPNSLGRPALLKSDTNTSIESDPFGDSKGVPKSIYD